MKKWSGLAAVAACLLSLVGCIKPLDGPGMVNDRPWREFTLTRSDSFAQYHFWFTVQVTETGYLLTGLDGTQQEKCLSDDISIEIYHRFLPYLKG